MAEAHPAAPRNFALSGEISWADVGNQTNSAPTIPATNVWERELKSLPGTKNLLFNLASQCNQLPKSFKSVSR